jgi:hypothetical protein
MLLQDARDGSIGREIGWAAGERKERRLRVSAAPGLAAFFLQVRLEPTVPIVQLAAVVEMRLPGRCRIIS